MLAHVERRLQGDLSIAALAARFDVPARTLQRRITAAVGEPIATRVARLRLERAHALLVEEVLTIAEIAQRCGFSSTKHLAHAFAQRYGMAPETYRRTVRERGGTGRG